MENEHWKDFYKKNIAPSYPTTFARFCLDVLPYRSKIIDVGCGNYRDTNYFIENGFNATGIDLAINDLSYSELNNDFDVIYSRFFLHALPKDELIDFIKWSANSSQDEVLFMAECRSIGDKPVLFTDHDRSLVNGTDLMYLLQSVGFDIVYYQKATGLAKYKSEDPLVIRIIAKLCKN